MTAIGSDILRQFGEQLVNELRAKTPSSSGKTASQIVMEVTDISLAIYGPSYIETFVYGRGPTKSKTSSGPTLKDQLLDWIEHEGIQANPSKTKSGKDNTPNSEQLAYIMARHIHMHGNKLYQSLKGGKTDYLSSILTNSRIDAFLGAFGNVHGEEVLSFVVDKWNSLKP